MWAQVVNALLGIWMMAAPSALGYIGTPAETSARIVGPIIASFATIAWWEATRGVRWANVPLAGWLCIAPLLVDHTAAAAANTMVTGMAVLGLSLVRGRITGCYGGGWRAAFQGTPQDRSQSSSQSHHRGSAIE